MPVILAPLADPFDLVIAGEQMRSLALTQGVDGTGMSSPTAIVEDVNMRTVSPLVQNDGSLLGMAGQDWGQGGPHDARVVGQPIRDNGVIATPCGALLPLQRIGLVIPTFVQSTRRWAVAGTTRNSVSTVLPGCRVVVLEVGRLQGDGAPVVGETISDGSGNYSVPVPLNTAYQVIAYLPGSPDVAGITRADVVPDPAG